MSLVPLYYVPTGNKTDTVITAGTLWFTQVKHLLV